MDCRQLLRFAEFRIEVQLDFATGALVWRVHDTSVKGTRVNVKAYGTLIEFPGIDHAMNGIRGIDSAGMRDVHFNRVERLQPASANRQVLPYEMEVFYVETADGNRHPAILIAMVVHRTRMSHFPADGHQFVNRRAFDQIARVVLAIP